jgi:ferredoxin-NADP reductase
MAPNSSGQVSTLIKRREVAERTMASKFATPAGFEFKAGQFLETLELSQARQALVPEANVSDCSTVCVQQDK